MSEEMEDVLVIRVQRPAGAGLADTRGMSFAAANQLGEKLAAMQTVSVETAERAFAEELGAAWERVGPIVTDVLAGRLNLGGEGGHAG